MKKIIALLRNTPEQAYTGIGMSVAPKYKLTEKWSKRISSEYKDDKFSPWWYNRNYVFSMRYYYSTK